MTARLLVREVGAREFVQHNSEYEDDPARDSAAVEDQAPALTGVDKAAAEGQRLTVEGNVEAFQVWSLVLAKQRVWGLEDIA